MKLATVRESEAVTDAPRTSLCVVVLDDSEFDRKRVERMIKKSAMPVQVVSCGTLEEFDEAITDYPADVCLIDHQLQGATGLDAMAKVKARLGAKSMPVIMISGREDVEAVVDSMRAGCVDYVGKGNLTAEKLQKVIYDAIADAFSGPDMTQEVLEATNNVLTGISNGCVTELQPRLRRMYNQASFIRSCHAQGVLPSPEALDEIEEHCLMIWRFFDEIAQYCDSLGKTRH